MRWLLSFAVTFAAACATSAPKQTAFMKEEGVAVSAEAMRVRVRAVAPSMMAEVEGAADRIRLSSADPRIQRAAVAWKLNTASALYRELFSQEPLAGLLDAWAMLIQMEDYLSRPEVKVDFGTAGAEALATTRDLEGRIEETLRWAVPGRDLAKVRVEIARWALAHPLDRSLAARRTLREDLAQRAAGEELSAFSAISAAQEDIQGIIARMDFLPTILPKQFLWEAELAYEDLAEPRVAQMLQRADAALGRAEQVVRWLGGTGLHELATEEREALMAAVNEQRLALGELVDEERSKVANLVASERATILEELRTERVAITEDARHVAKAATDDAAHAAKDVANYVLLRVALLVAGAILLWGVVAFLVRRTGPAGSRPS